MNAAILAIFRSVNDWNHAADVADGASSFEIAHHVDEIIGGIKRVFLNGFERRDALFVETERVIGLAQDEYRV